MLRKFFITFSTRVYLLFCTHFYLILNRRPCSEMGFQRIIQEFEKAADLLESGYTFQQVCQLA